MNTGIVLVPGREALTGFAMLLVPVVVLCQGTAAFSSYKP